MPFNKYKYKEFVRNYDKTIEALVPDYCEMTDVLISYIPKDAQSIVDIGCGSGNILTLLKHKEYHRIVGIDISSDLLKKAEQKCPKYITFIESDFLEYNNPQKFDVIISSLFWHELYKSQRKIALEKMKNMLGDDGILLLSDHLFIQGDLQRETEISRWYNHMISNGVTDKDAITEIEVHIREELTFLQLKKLAMEVGFFEPILLWNKGFFHIISFKLS